MNKFGIGLWKQTSKNGKVTYYVGYFMNLRIALFDNKEAKKKNPKAPDLRIIVSTMNNLNQKLENAENDLDFSTVENEDNPFETEAEAQA